MSISKEQSTLKPSQGLSLYLWFVCMVAAMSGLLFGYDAVVVSGTNSQVQAQFQFTPAQLGFYVSCVLWGCAAGSTIAGFIADVYGRKKLLYIASILILISATWSGLAGSAIQLILARLIGGVGLGVATMVCPLYISEISPEQYRGRMVTLFQFTINIGIVMCVFVNWGIFSFAEANTDSETLSKFMKWFAVDENWRAMFSSEALPALLFMGCTFFLPESPRWLIKQNRNQEALSILERVNSKHRAKEISIEIEDAIKMEGDVGFMDLFSAKLRRPLILSVLICFFAIACGGAVIFYYGPTLIEEAGFGLGKSLGGFGTIAIVNLIGSLFALKYIDSAGAEKCSLLAHSAVWPHISPSERYS